MTSPINSQHIKINDVYYVDPGPDRIMNPVAINPEIEGDKIWWFDTSRGKSLTVSHIKMEPEPTGETTPEKIIILTKDGFQVNLTKLDLNIYNAKVKSRVIGSPEFHSDKEVHDFYLR